LNAAVVVMRMLVTIAILVGTWWGMVNKMVGEDWCDGWKLYDIFALKR